MFRSLPVCVGRILPAVAVAAVLLVLAVGASSQAQSLQDPRPLGLSILASDANSILLELRVPPIALATETVEGTVFTTVALDDAYQWTERSGWPMLPVYRTLIGIPEHSSVQVEIVEVAEERLEGAVTVYPVPETVLSQLPAPGERLPDPANPAPTSTEQRFAFDEAFYARDARYPAKLVEVSDKGVMRDQVVARLQFHPVRANPARGELWYTSRIVARVRFDGAQSNQTKDTGVNPGGADPLAVRSNTFDEALAGMLLNYQQALPWRVPRQSAPLQTSKPLGMLAPDVASADTNRYRIDVIDEGMVELSYGSLAASGIPVDSVDPARLRVQHGATAVALEVTGSNDGRFDPGDVVRFFAEALDSPYTWHNVYWLTYDSTPGQAAAARNVSPAAGGATPADFTATRHFEESHFYQSELPREGFEADRWYWTYTFFRSRGAIISRTVTFTLDIPSTAPHEATVQVLLRGGTSRFLSNPDHYARIFINDTPVGEAYFDGYEEYNGEFTFDGGLLQTGPNRFTLNSPGGLPSVAEDAAFVNWFEVTYQQSYTAVGDRLGFSATGPGRQLVHVDGFTTPNILLYDVTNPAQMVRLTNFSVTAAGADVYRLSFSDSLADETRRYLAVGASQIVTPVAIVADTPSSLRSPATGADYLIITHADFVAPAQALAALRASTGFQPVVIDVQDIYDEFNEGVLSPVAIRDFLAYAYSQWPDPEPAYVLLLGDGTYDFKNYLGYGSQTLIPPYLDAVDPFIGETATDNRYVTIVGNDPLPDVHIGRLPANTQGEAWTMVNKIINYETNPPPGDWRFKTVFVTDNADTAGNFPYLSNEVADSMVPDPPFQVDKIYYGVNYTDILSTREAVRSAINDGALLVNYVGHSSITWWAAEILLGVNDTPNLTNGDRLPVMLPMTCYDGYFHSPLISGMAETIVRANGRGAVASWSATGQGVATGHDQMHRGFFDAIFSSGIRHLGPATLAGKMQLYKTDQRFRDLIDTYGLLGDPALELLLPQADLSLDMTVEPAGPVQQGDAITYTMTYVNNSLAPVPNAVLTTAIPSALENVVITSSDPEVTLRLGTQYVWDLGALSITEGGTITMSGRVPDALTTLDAPYQAGSRVLSVWQEANLANNKGGPLLVPVLPSDLEVSLEGPTTGVVPGSTVVLKISYRNNGPADATTPRLYLPVADWLEDITYNHTGPQPTPIPGTALAWELPTLPPGSAGTIKVRGALDTDLSAALLPLHTQAVISTPWFDDQPANNRSDPVTIAVYVADAYEPDDTRDQATPMIVPGASDDHSESAPDDVDWFRFEAHADLYYDFRVVDLSAGGDTLLSLFDGQGNLLAQNDDFSPGSAWSGLGWTAPASGAYFVSVRGTPQSLPGFNYGLRVETIAFRHFLPLINTP